MSKNTTTRSLLKAITYRIIGTVATTAISYLVTGNMKFGLAIGSLDVAFKLAIYFFHERAWQHIDYGKKD